MSLLSKVETGIKQRPFFVGIHGPAGVGKTTWAANAPKPLFLATEDGTDQLDVSRLEIGTWPDFRQALTALNSEKHDYKTVIVDSGDHLESKIHAMVAHDQGKKSIEDIGYAKGYIFALEYWRQMLAQFKTLRKNGVNIIMINHSIIKKMADPVVGESYDRYELKLHRKAADLICESMDALLFAKNEVLISKDSATKRVSAMGDGTRVLYTEYRPAYEAKNRYGLPLELPLSWDEFSKLALRSDSEKAVEIHKKIDELMKNNVDEEFSETVEKTVNKFKNNVPKLEEILTKIKGRIENG